MDDMRRDPSRNEPERQPEPIAASLIGQCDLADRPASTHRLASPPLNQSQRECVHDHDNSNQNGAETHCERQIALGCFERNRRGHASGEAVDISADNDDGVGCGAASLPVS
jgi:hypothetical protein